MGNIFHSCRSWNMFVMFKKKKKMLIKTFPITGLVVRQHLWSIHTHKHTRSYSHTIFAFNKWAKAIGRYDTLNLLVSLKLSRLWQRLFYFIIFPFWTLDVFEVAQHGGKWIETNIKGESAVNGWNSEHC